MGEIEQMFINMQEKQGLVSKLISEVAEDKKEIAIKMILSGEMRKRIGSKNVVAMRGFRMVNPTDKEVKYRFLKFLMSIMKPEDFAEIVFFNTKKMTDIYGDYEDEINDYMRDNPELKSECSEPWIFLGRYSIKK